MQLPYLTNKQDKGLTRLAFKGISSMFPQARRQSEVVNRSVIQANSLNNLTILQTLKAKKLPNGEVLLTRKFMEAILKFIELWPGSITVMMEETQQENDNLDKQIFKLNQLPFQLKLVDFDTITPAQLRNQTSVRHQ